MAECGVLEIAKLSVSIAQLVLQGQQVKLAKHAPKLEDIGNKMSRIRDELDLIQKFLDAQDITNGDGTLESWISQVRTLANRTQDLVDDYDHFLSHELGYRFGDITRKILLNDRISIGLSEIDEKLKKVEKDLTELKERRERWVQQKPNTGERAPLVPHFLDEEELVGIKGNRENLVRLLQSEESALSVISVSGMGG